MAVSSLQIQIQAFVQGLADVQKLGQEIAATAKTAESTTASSTKYGEETGKLTAKQRELADSHKKLNSDLASAGASFNVLTGFVQKAAIAFIAYAGVSSLKGAADIAARNETLGVVLNVVGKNAGYSKGELDKYEEGLKKLGITTSASRDALVQMIQAGLRVGPAVAGGVSQIEQLARAAQDLAVASGKNSSETLRQVITNIQQLDTVGLKFMGLVIDTEAAYEKFAQSINRSAAGLTTQQKQQAFANAVLEKSIVLQGAYEASLETVGKKIQSMARYQEEASAAIGETLLPAYTVLVDTATAFLKAVKETFDGINATGTVAQTLKTVFQAIAGAVTSVAKELYLSFGLISTALGDMGGKLAAAFATVDFKDLSTNLSNTLDILTGIALSIIEGIAGAAPFVATLAGAFKELFKTLKTLTEGFSFLSDGMKDSITLTDVFSVAFIAIGYVVAGFTDGLKLVKVVVLGVLSGLQYAFGAYLQLQAAITVGDLSKGLKAASEASYALAGANNKAASEIVDGFKRGETALASYQASLAKTGSSAEAIGEKEKAAATKREVGYKQAEEALREYTAYVRDNGKETAEIAKRGTELNAVLAKLAKEFDLTQKQTEVLSAKLKNVQEAADPTSKALKDLGLTAGMLDKRLSDAGQIGAQAFINLAAEGVKSSEQLFFAFSKGLGMAETIKDLTAFSVGLKQAADDGRITATALASGTELVRQKFDELYKKASDTATTEQAINTLRNDITEFAESTGLATQRVIAANVELANKTRDAFKAALDTKTTIGAVIAFAEESRAQFKKNEITFAELEKRLDLVHGAFERVFATGLKAAKTKEDFERLSAAAQDAFTKGDISGLKFNETIARISEAFTKARENAVLFAAQQAEAAAKTSSVIAASTDVVKASVEIQKAKNEVVKAEKELREQGTPVAKLQLELARNQLQVAEQQYGVNRAKLAEEVAGYDLLIAKQQELIALKKVEREPNNEIAASALLFAQQQVEKKEILNSKAKEGVEIEQQQLSLLQQETAVLQQQVEVEKEKAAAADANGKKDSDRASSTATALAQYAAFLDQRLVKEAAGNEKILEQARKQASQLMKNSGMYSSIVEALKDMYNANENARGSIEGYNRLLANTKKTTEEITANTQKVNEAWGNIDESLKLASFGLTTYKLGVMGIGSAFQATDAAMRAALFEQNKALTEYEKTLRKIKIGAYEAALAFGNTARSIREELLQLQGKDDEIAKARYEQRKKELDLEYLLVAAKLKFAIAQTGEKDGGPLSRALLDLNEQYKQSKENLAEIFTIEQKNRDKTKAEAAQKTTEEKRAASDKTKGDAEAERLRIDAANKDSENAAKKTEADKAAQAALENKTATEKIAADAKQSAEEKLAKEKDDQAVKTARDTRNAKLDQDAKIAKEAQLNKDARDAEDSRILAEKAATEEAKNRAEVEAQAAKTLREEEDARRASEARTRSALQSEQQAAQTTPSYSSDSNVLRPDFSQKLNSSISKFNPDVILGGLQSIAGKDGESAKSQEPQIVVKFDDGSLRVNATIAESSSDDFLKLVTKARRLS